MTTISFSSMVLNEAQTEAIRLMEIASFLKVDRNQILGKFSKWLVDSFDPYTICLSLLDGQTRGESFKRNFIIYLVNCFFNGSNNHCCSKSLLKYIASLNRCQFNLEKLINSARHYKESKAVKEDDDRPSFPPTFALSQPDSEAPIPITMPFMDASICADREEHHDNDDEEDDDGAPLTIPLRNTSHANCDLSIKKSLENKSKVGEKPALKKGEMRNMAIMIKKPTVQHSSGSKAPSPHVTKQSAQTVSTIAQSNYCH
ncbi:LOW QUALITY PROTEIN: hypothetical protein Cgig2_028060 [Carnegiea gigantea]|uniref:Uncharacterized protein n=1 Tax=Carnegiea gigantea TaxID=171969 RepID=A0A9Q1GKT8_9CARY|nr:LOW QUALITY PROTEIN: hypothetical protein Cgig2_028060 [Carnegiea gigantea]